MTMTSEPDQPLPVQGEHGHDKTSSGAVTESGPTSNKHEAEKSSEADIRPATSESDHSAADTATEKQNEDIEATAQQEPAAVYSVFSPGMKRLIVILATISSLFSPVSSFIYLPAINTLADYYGESVARINLTVTTYQILQGLAPMFYGNMADAIGRRPVYILTFLVYLGANLGLALQNSYGALLVLRALQSAGSSATVALGNAVIADIANSAERAGWMGYVYAGVMIGPAFAPTIGGLVTQFLSWRWIFWLLLILNGAYLFVYAVFNPETGRNVVDNGSLPPPRLNMTIPQFITDIRQRRNGEVAPEQSEERRLKAAELRAKRGKFRFPNPIASLRCLLEPDIALVLGYQALMVAAFYSLMVPITPIFTELYGFNQLQVGLCYIPFAVGAATGSIAGGKFLNVNFRRWEQKLGIKVDRNKASRMTDFPIERARLEYIFYPNLLAGAGLLAWGWALDRRSSLAGPLVVMALTALGSSGSSTMTNTLVVDLYPQSPATVSAAGNITRCLVSAAASAIIQYIIDALGVGWCFTLLAGIVVLASSMIAVVMKYGPGWRSKRVARLEKVEAKEKEELEVKQNEARAKERAQIEAEKTGR